MAGEGGAAAAAIEVRGLTKSYGGDQAVRGIDLRIGTGEVFALLGPNGAGKTTTVEILEGYRRRDGGDVAVLGLDPGRRAPAVEEADRDRPAVDGRRPVPHRRRDGRDVRRLLSAPASGRRGDRPRRPRREACRPGRRRCPAANSADSTWRSRWPATPTCCSSTSPTTGFDPSARHEAWQIVKDLAAPGQDGAADHALHGRGAEPRRPGRRDRARADRRRGHARRRWPGATTARPVVSYRARRGRAAAARARRAQHPATGSVEFARRRPARGLHRSHRLGDRQRRPARRRCEVLRPSLEDVYLQLTSDAADDGAGAMNAVALTLFQMRYVNKAFWRNPASAFFTFAFPLMFLVIFTALLGHGDGARRRPRRAPVHLLRRRDGGVRGHHLLLQQHRHQR